MTPEEAAIRARDAAAPKTGNGITKQYGRGEGSRAVRDRRELIGLLDAEREKVERLEAGADLRFAHYAAYADGRAHERARILARVDKLRGSQTWGDNLLERSAVRAAIEGGEA